MCHVPRAPGCALLVLLLSLPASTAHAQVDAATTLPVLVEMLAEQVAQGVTLVRQLQSLSQQADAAMKSLQALDRRAFTQVHRMLLQCPATLLSVGATAGTIGHSLQDVEQQLQAVYGRGPGGARFSDGEAQLARWQGEVAAAAQLAIRAQASAECLKSSAEAAQGVMAQSSLGGGQVSQLQSVVQMLGLMHQQLGHLAESIDTAGRVTSTLAAGAVAERQAERDYKRRMLEGYESRGRPVAVRRTMPELR